MRHGAVGPPRWLLPALSFVFFLSGASALIYQVLWLRMLGLVFGVTVYAASTVWASFMAGLAVGSFAAGRFADRMRRPLVWFGLCELGIALSAASTPLVFDLLRGLYPNLSPALRGDLATATAIRFGLSFAVLLIPTALMGATLPLVLRSSIFRSERLGTSAGVLYGSNTAGAIAGALIAGLYFIPVFGMTATFSMAGALNLLAAAAAIALSAAVGSAKEAEPAVDRTRTVTALIDDLSPGARRVVLLVFSLSGAAAMALEIIWLRLTVLIVGPTVYAVSILVACVLCGIAAGSYLVTPFLRKPARWLVILAVVEGAVALSGVVSLTLLTEASAAVRAIPQSVAHLIAPYLIPVITAGLLVALPTSLLMGVAFPIGLQLWAVRADDPEGSAVASRIGVFYSLNVCGGIVGSLAAGFLLLPWIGSRASLIAVSSAALASALALVAVSSARVLARIVGSSVLAAAFILLARSAPEPVDALLAQRHPSEPVLWREEGIQSTVSVHAILNGSHRAMYSEGYHQADDTGGMTLLHYQIGTLPLALHPNPRTGLVVGLGGGSTAGAAGRYSGLDLDVVELSDTVVRASEFFHNINFDVLRRPNVHLRVDDGRNYLALTRQRYDIITADTIQPVRAGAASLYSVEYFRLVKHALNDGGIALQWFNGTEAEYKLVARTFLSVFPDTTAWGDGTLLLGRKSPLRLEASDFNWKLQIPELRDAFRSIGLNRFEDLTGMFHAGPEELRRFAGDGPLLTDDRPILEYFLSLPRATLDLSRVKGDVRQYLAAPPP